VNRILRENLLGEDGLLVDDGTIQVAIGFALEGFGAAEHTVEHDTVREDIGRGAVQLVLNHFRGGVPEDRDKEKENRQKEEERLEKTDGEHGKGK
jgi:hypothetical protein